MIKIRLPNGYGSCTKLTGKRRRPYMARVTIGWADDAKQIMKVLGYYHTKVEALAALAEYNKAPVDLDLKDITFEKLYELWAKEKYGDEKQDKQYSSAYKWCESIHKTIFNELKTSHFQKIIDDCPRSFVVKRTIKSLINMMTKYAIANDIVSKSYITMVTLPQETQSTLHQPFTKEEITLLWKYTKRPNIKPVLIYIYTGMRPIELLKMERANIYLDKNYMVGGVKTEAGINRIIPIANKIKPIIEELLQEHQESTTLMCNKYGEPLNYDFFKKNIWDEAMREMNMKHLPHDGRHTCATLLDNVEPAIKPKIIKLILGHSIRKDVTQKVYTHKTIEQLIEAINKI